MTSDDAAAELLHTLVPGELGDSDWKDVLRRSRVRRERRRRRLTLVVVAATVILLGVLASPAVGFGDELLNRLEGLSPKAREEIAEIESGRQFEPKPGTRREYAHTTVNGRRWYVITYENVFDEFCDGVVGGVRGVGCGDREDNVELTKPIALFGPGATASSPLMWNTVWFYGFVQPGIASLELITVDCTRMPLELDRRWFLHVENRKGLESGHWPYLLVARSAEGNVVAKRLIGLRAPDSPAPTSVEERTPKPDPACTAEKF